MEKNVEANKTSWKATWLTALKYFKTDKVPRRPRTNGIYYIIDGLTEVYLIQGQKVNIVTNFLNAIDTAG